MRRGRSAADPPDASALSAAQGWPAKEHVFHARTQVHFYWRACAIAASYTPCVALLLNGRLKLQELVSLLLVTFSYLLLVGFAAWLPAGVPAKAALPVGTTFLIQSFIDARNGFERWGMNDDGGGLQITHRARAVASWAFAAAALCIATDLFRKRCERFWPSVRLMMALGSALRLVINLFVMSHLDDTQADAYLPGRLTFQTSICFNLSAIALGTVGLSPRARHRLSAWTGGANVVFTLAELQEREPREANATEAGGSRRTRWATQQLMGASTADEEPLDRPHPIDEGEQGERCSDHGSSRSHLGVDVHRPQLVDGSRLPVVRVRLEDLPHLSSHAAGPKGSPAKSTSSVGQRALKRRPSQSDDLASVACSSSAASELGCLWAEDGRSREDDEQRLASCTLQSLASTDCSRYPSHRLRPQYFGDGASAALSADFGDGTGSRAAALRARLQLYANSLGELVDSSGVQLAPDGEVDAMYVMVPHGDIYTTCALADTASSPTVHHSSLVCGAPVAAAGLLTLCRGRLLRLSNESGHYAPPASSLRAVLHQLARLGVSQLNEVQLELVFRPEYEPAGGCSEPGGEYGPAFEDQQPRSNGLPAAIAEAHSPSSSSIARQWESEWQERREAEIEAERAAEREHEITAYLHGRAHGSPHAGPAGLSR